MNAKIWITAALTACLSSLPAQALTAAERAGVYESYAFERKADYAHAIEKMTKLHASNPGNYFVNLRLGWLFSFAKKTKNAVEHYEQAAKIAPTAVEPWLSLSLLHLNLADYPSALAASQSLLKVDPKNYYGFLRAVTAQIRLKKYDAALAQVNEAVSVYPTDAVFLEQKGFLLISLGKAQEGREVLADLLLVSPQNAYAKSVIGEK